jgi:hypothetical protein
MGKPKPGDYVKVKYYADVLKPNGKSGGNFIDTEHIGKQVAFKVTSTKNGGQPHQGLYVGLNEAVQNMLLGEEAKLILSSDMAFGDEGLPKHYNANSGFLGSSVGIIGVAMANDPNAPKGHHGRNPLCVAYIGVPPNSEIQVKIALLEINGHRRAIKEMTCLDCILSSLTYGLGCNASAMA